MKARSRVIWSLWLMVCVCRTALADPQYGPVTQGENVWSIASDLQTGTTLPTAELVEWLYRENPHAFHEQDIDLLRVGSTLRLPVAGETPEDSAEPDATTSDSPLPNELDPSAPEATSGREAKTGSTPTKTYAPRNTIPAKLPTQTEPEAIGSEGRNLSQQAVVSNTTPLTLENTDVAPEGRPEQLPPRSERTAVSDLAPRDGVIWVYTAALTFVFLAVVYLMLLRRQRRQISTRPVATALEDTAETASEETASLSNPRSGSSRATTRRLNGHGSGHQELPIDHFDPILAFLHHILRIAAYALAITMLFVVLEGVVTVMRTVFLTIVEAPYLIIPDIVKTFGAFLAVLIAYEIFANITLYIRSDVFPVKLVIATALMAVARKVIVLDMDEYTEWDLVGIGAVVISLGVAYWLISQADLCSQKDRPAER